jgi:hypothetical protein
MEPMQTLTHPDDAQLAAFLDPAVGTEALEALAAHLDLCPQCVARLERIEPAFSQSRLCLKAVHSRIARSPRRDEDLWAKMERLESGRSIHRPVWRLAWRLAWTSGIAAALIALAILVLPGGRGSELRAETLLAQVDAATGQTTVNRRLLIRTRTASFVRSPDRHPGDTAEEKAVRARFIAAHYDWRDPLGPRSYAGWRHSLKHKTSKVFASGQTEQCIETTTSEGTLVDASLTLDAKLVPVKGSFRFADQEYVEITPVPDPDPAPNVPSAKVPESAPRLSLAERQLEVSLAIDSLHVGAGEPIEVAVEPSGSILVTTYHLTDAQQMALQSNLDKIPGVTLRAASGAGPAVSPQLPDRSDSILHLSQDVSFEAHALAELAKRFDSVETTLNPAGSRSLRALRKKHAAELIHDLGILQRELNLTDGAAPAIGSQVQDLAACASNLDRLISELYAGSVPDSEQAEMKRQLQSEFTRLHSLASAYSKSLEQIP